LVVVASNNYFFSIDVESKHVFIVYVMSEAENYNGFFYHY